MRHFIRYSFRQFLVKLPISGSICGLVLLAGSLGFGQNSSNSNTSPSPSPTLIPLGSTVSESDKAMARIREIEAFLAEQFIPASIADGIPATRVEIDELKERTAAVFAGQVTLETISSSERDWQAIRTRLNDWKNRIQQQSKSIDDRIAELRTLRERWAASKAAISGQTNSNTVTENSEIVPEEVIRRADSVLAAVANVEKQAGSQRAEFLTLESRVSELQVDTDQAIAELKQRRERQLANILSQNESMIWSANWSELNPQNFAPSISGSISRQWQDFSGYAARYSHRFAWHAVLLIGLIALFFWTRRNIVPIVEKEPKLQKPAVFFKMPFAAALIVSVFFVPWLYPQTPRLLSTIIGAAAIIPGILILRRIVESPLNYLLYGLLGLYLLDRIRDILSDLPLLTRIFFSVEMLAACAFLLWFYRSKRVEKNVEAGAYSVFLTIRKIIPFAAVIFALALIGNLLGFLSISYLVGNGLLRAAYLAIFLYTAVQIFISALAFALRVKPLASTRAVRNNRMLIRQRATQVLKWLAAFIWVIGVLNLFSIQDVVYSALGSIIGFQINIGEISITLGDILLFVLMIWMAVLISRFVRFILEEDVFPRIDIGGGVSFAISSVVHYLVLIGGFFIAISAVGFDLSRFAIVAGAVGIGLGFGLQNIINNFVSGLILLFERPVKVGDTIQIGDHTGALKSIGLRASVLRKADGADVIVPNSQLISDRVINWTLSDDKRRIDIPVGVAYGTDPRPVLKLLADLAIGREPILTDPAPRALFVGFGESSLKFELRFWVLNTDAWVALRSEMVTEIFDTLTAAGIEFPQNDLVIKGFDPEPFIHPTDEEKTPEAKPARPAT